jgi:4-carboxymuconolactone decarboxylase
MKFLTRAAALLLAVAFGILLGGRIEAQTAFNLASLGTPGGPGLPADIYPDSRERLPLPRREDMDDFGKAVYDRVATPATERAGRSAASVKLWDPRYADPVEKAYHYLKFDDGLGDRLTQIAVLTTAREMRNEYEWTQWESISWEPTQPAYVDPVVVDIIKNEKPVTGLDPKVAAIITFARELVGNRNHVSPEAFHAILTNFGPRLTMDIVALIGLYMAAGAEITAFDLQLKPGQKPLLPAAYLKPDCSKS